TYTEAMLGRFAAGDEALASSIWPLEIANALVVAERRGLLKPAHSAAFVEELGQLPIRVNESSTGRAFAQVLEVARRYRLTAYDATYLDLAMREALPPWRRLTPRYARSA
ncbi:MAG: type II toxin-antitoxin system VapC family toxin, partial [Candidatus Binataceae bacterium]